WSAKTVAEDLYLSYLALMDGRKLIFRDDLHCPSELPWDLNSFLIQQRRWAKGGAQVFRLLAWDIIKMPSWSFLRKLDSLLTLGGYFIATIIALAYLTTPLWIAAKAELFLKSPHAHIYELIDVGLWLTLGA